MNSTQVVFSSPNQNWIPETTAIHFRVNTMEWNDMGGPAVAEISASGGRHDLLNLLYLLGSKAEITSGWGFVWWGLVNTIMLQFPGLEVSYSLDGLHNRVAVAYTYVGAGAPTGGVRKTTSYLQDTDSIALFGTHEYLYSGNNLSDAAAVSQQTILLATSKLPQGAATMMRGGGLGKFTAVINCIGYYKTLDWRYANVPAQVSVSYTTLGAAEQVIGSADNNQKILQQFTVGSSNIHVIQAKVNIRTQGSPTDEISVNIYALDGSGNPTGSALLSGSIPAYLLSGTAAWMTVSFTDTVLTASTQYGLTLERSTFDATNYYVANVNESLGYSGGVFKYWNSNMWANRTPNADMPFQILIDPQVVNTTQVANLVNSFGGFLAGTVIEDVSSETTGSYRDGDTTVLSVVEELLRPGGPNDRKYRVTVTRERYLVIEERPAKSAGCFLMDGRGKLQENGMKASPFETALGQWVGLTDFNYETSLVNLHGIGPQYVVGATWTPETGTMPQFEGVPGEDEFLAVYK